MRRSLTPEVFDFLDAEPRLDSVVAMAKNAVVQRHAESAMQVARAQSEVRGETAHVHTDIRYAARTWGHERRVVIKAEVVRVGLEFVIRPPLEAGPCPGSGRSNAHG